MFPFFCAPMIPTIKHIRSHMEHLPLAGLGEFRSHDEFAQELFVLLREAGGDDNSSMSLPTVGHRIVGLMRSRGWYEEAVLGSMGILSDEGQMREQMLRVWILQAEMLDACPPYAVLCSIAALWDSEEDGNFQLCTPGTLPEEKAQSALPEPEWVRVLHAPIPADKTECIPYCMRLCTVLESCEEDLSFTYYRYRMSRDEPDLLPCNLRMLRDMYHGESHLEYEERMERYAQSLKKCSRSYEQIQNRIREAFVLAESMGTELLKKQALMRLVRG